MRIFRICPVYNNIEAKLAVRTGLHIASKIGRGHTKVTLCHSKQGGAGAHVEPARARPRGALVEEQTMRKSAATVTHDGACRKGISDGAFEWKADVRTNIALSLFVATTLLPNNFIHVSVRRLMLISMLRQNGELRK